MCVISFNKMISIDECIFHKEKHWSFYIKCVIHHYYNCANTIQHLQHKHILYTVTLLHLLHSPVRQSDWTKVEITNCKSTLVSFSPKVISPH